MSPDPQPADPRPAKPDPVRGAEPPPLTKPPRSALSVRDMVGALLVLVVVVLVLGGITRSCSFAPGGPTTDPSALPVVDAPATLRQLRCPFPLRVPAVPAGWRSNSVAQDRVQDGRVVRVGYLTPEGRYLRLLQSDAVEPVLVAVEAGSTPVAATAPVEVGGQRWTVYSRGSGEPIWTAEVPTPGGPPVRMLITGSGTEDEARALAAAAVGGDLLPARAP